MKMSNVFVIAGIVFVAWLLRGFKSSAGYIWPVDSRNITSPFGMRFHPITGVEKMHEGIDIADDDGVPVYAVAAGSVVTSEFDSRAGNYVKILHDDGRISKYLHLRQADVVSGQTVHQGDVIGYMGATGAVTGVHLHFGIKEGDNWIDPMSVLT